MIYKLYSFNNLIYNNFLANSSGLYFLNDNIDF